MKYRILTKAIQKAIKTFPAVVITGPRQSGKTTLLKALFADQYQYVNLENPDVKLRAQDDPNNFLDQLSNKVILDEIQYVPELLSYIKDRIDKKRTPGQWLLTGSQNFILMQDVGESLAGRAAILSLLPFSFCERINNGEHALSIADRFKKEADGLNKKYDLAEIILRGSYPEIASNNKVSRELWCSSYITTYLERDIRNLSQVGDLGQFERFLRLCATRTGQILNISDLARDIGISVPTAKHWLSMLETGYQIFLLYPYYQNIGKRLVKSPKLYFNDTALASYLLGIENKKTLLASPQFPYLFETLIITDFWKRFLHFGQMPSLYYIRTRDGLEIDLVLEISQKLHLMEVKSSATITPKHAHGLIKLKNELGKLIKSSSVISQADNFSIIRGINSYNWQFLLER